jgi:hypothetical protein
MNQRLAHLIRSGQATTKDLEGAPAAEVLAIKAAKDEPQYRYFQSDPTAPADNSRVLRYVINQQTPDRLGDIVVQRGMDSSLWDKNPVVLWSHERKELPPIGRGMNKVIDTSNGVDRTIASVEFAPKEASQFAENLYQLGKAGFLKATSIGIFPTDIKDVTDAERKELGMTPWGVYIEKSEMFEFSLCSIGMHPEALELQMKKFEAAGISDRTTRDFLKKFPLTERDHERLLAEAKRAFVSLSAPAPKEKSPKCRQSGETKEKCVERKIPEIMKDNPSMDQKQAEAIAFSMCSKGCGKAKKKLAAALERIADSQAALAKAIETLVEHQAKQAELATKQVAALSDFTKHLARAGGSSGGAPAPEAAKPDASSQAELKKVSDLLNSVNSAVQLLARKA